jgi:hypothetical protein
VLFFNSVDPETDGLPDYDQIVHHSMDLTTVPTNLERKAYKSPQ